MRPNSSNRKHLDFQDIQWYLEKGEVCERKKEIDHHLQDCPLCKSAVDGYSLGRNFPKERESLQELYHHFQVGRPKNLDQRNQKENTSTFVKIGWILLLLSLLVTLLFFQVF